MLRIRTLWSCVDVILNGILCIKYVQIKDTEVENKEIQVYMIFLNSDLAK